MRLYQFLLLFIFSIGFSFAQNNDFNIDIIGYGRLSTEEEAPFWLHANNRGRLDEKTNVSGLIQITNQIDLGGDRFFQLGLSPLYKNGYEDGVKIDEAYFSYLTPKIGVTVGAKHEPDVYNGLSATNVNILWSTNASAIPGIQFFTRDPLFINGDSGIGFMGSLEEYFMDDDRYIENTRLHHKSFHIVYRNDYDFEISAGVQHFVQWAGISEEFGKLPNSFEDYITIFTSGASNEVGGQEINALGNQIGSYEIKVNSKISDLDFQFIYNHIFEDASGMKMGNFPDGRYAIYVEDNRDSFWGSSWFKAFMYEFYYTKNQSRTRRSSLVDGADNYFNNNLYRSGWTYKNQVIGVPFILLNENRFRIGTNILAVHHFGISGTAFEEYP